MTEMGSSLLSIFYGYSAWEVHVTSMCMFIEVLEAMTACPDAVPG